MATKPKKRSFSALYRERGREIRRASEADGHSVALRDSEESDMESFEAGQEPEPIHDRDRTSTDENTETNTENDSDPQESDRGNGE